MEDTDVPELDASSPEVFDKIKASADITNRALATVIAGCKPGARIAELCSVGDKFILDTVKTVFIKQKIDRGIAFPTSISVNNIAGHFSPLSDDPATLKEGDVVKVDLGTHIDGFIAQAAHTMICIATSPGEVVTGRKADAICAAHFAAEAALRLFKPGNTNKQITDVINSIAKTFNCNLVEGVLSHQLKRFVIDGNNVVLSRESLEHKVEEVTFQLYDVFAFDIVMSTGEGKVKETEARTTIYKRAIGKNYKLKMASARGVFSEISRQFSTMPFALRNFQDEKRAKLGMTELVKHELVDTYPVLYEKEGEYIAQFKFTAVLTTKETVKLTSHPLPFVKSDFEITDAKIKNILASGTKRNKKKKKKKGGNNNQAATGTASAPSATAEATAAATAPTVSAATAPMDTAKTD